MKSECELGPDAGQLILMSAPCKKHNAIAYHRVREAIAGGIICFAKVDSKGNLANCLTKPLPKDD